MNADLILEVVSKLIAYIGSGAMLVLGLSSWLGKVWANRILEKDKLKYHTELENVKNKYNQELAKYKSKLEKDKAVQLRYSEYQFNLYHDLWGSLVGLRLTATNLWDVADQSNLYAFERQLRITTKNVEKNRLLFEESHYKQLIDILAKFGNFKFGKVLLIGLRKQIDNSNLSLNNQEIEFTIERNKKTKEDFTLLLEKLAKEFRSQIAGN